MARGDRIELELNVPVTGCLQDLFWAPTKHPDKYEDQVCMVGTFDGAQVHSYLPHQAVDAFIKLGVVKEQGTTDAGHPKFRVLFPRRVISVVRKPMKNPETDRKYTATLVSWADGEAEPGDEAPAKPARRQQREEAPPPEQEPGQRRTPPAEETGEAGRQKALQAWLRLGEEYATCHVLVAHATAKSLSCQLTDLDQQAIQAGAATLLIRARELGHVSFRGLARAVMERLAKNGHADPEPKEPPAKTPPASQQRATVPAGGPDDDEGQEDDLPF